MNNARGKLWKRRKRRRSPERSLEKQGSVLEISSPSIHLEAEDTIEDILKSGKVNTISIDYFYQGTSRGSSEIRGSAPSQLTAKTTETSSTGSRILREGRATEDCSETLGKVLEEILFQVGTTRAVPDFPTVRI